MTRYRSRASRWLARTRPERETHVGTYVCTRIYARLDAQRLNPAGDLLVFGWTASHAGDPDATLIEITGELPPTVRVIPRSRRRRARRDR